jgi:hypothetical protein
LVVNETQPEREKFSLQWTEEKSESHTIRMPKGGRKFAVGKALTIAGIQLRTRHMDTAVKLDRNTI